ncbi:MAG: energy-coupling factor transporter transmembrane protein EcfT [Cyanobacteria bacterium]|nr:energy-coupling factor transporter transmembrane protein EcfT [Cyanobacteriota bacterium]
MRFFEYMEKDSILHKINPTVKLILIIVIMLVITFAYDPYTPLIFCVLALIMITALGKINLKQVIKMVLPLILILLAITVTSILSYNTALETNPKIIADWWIFKISLNSLKFGLTIGFRTLCFLLFSLLFVATTEPADFIISLIVQLKLSPRIGFGTLAGYRFIPLLSAEYQNIYDAHKIRGIKDKNGFIAKFMRFKKYSVPLLVTASRKAQRTAIAMDSKCFYAFPKRTYLRDLRIKRNDIIFIILVVTVSAVTIFLLSRFNIIIWGYRSIR